MHRKKHLTKNRTLISGRWECLIKSKCFWKLMAQWFVNDQEETILASPLKFFNSNTFISLPLSSLSLRLTFLCFIKRLVWTEMSSTYTSLGLQVWRCIQFYNRWYKNSPKFLDHNKVAPSKTSPEFINFFSFSWKLCPLCPNFEISNTGF